MRRPVGVETGESGDAFRGYHNSNLFSNYYLDERIYDLEGWDCDEAAREAFEEIEIVETTVGDGDLIQEWGVTELFTSL